MQDDFSGGGVGVEGQGVDLIKLLYLPYVLGLAGLCKQCRPRPDTTERGVWSGSTQFVTHPDFFSKIHT